MIITDWTNIKVYLNKFITPLGKGKGPAKMSYNRINETGICIM